MSERQCRVPKHFSPAPETKWRESRPFGINYREDSSRPDTQSLVVRLDGTADGLTDSHGDWDKTCIEKYDGVDTVLSYSGGSVKDRGTTGSGAWHVKGCSLAYSHREYQGTHTIYSGRVELLYTLRCLSAIRLAGWEGKIYHRLDNEGGVKKCKHISRGFRTTTTTDADLWMAMCSYLDEWRGETEISWVKAHAEDGGAKTNDHEKQNKRADDDAEEAYGHPDPPYMRAGTAPSSRRYGALQLAAKW